MEHSFNKEMQHIQEGYNWVDLAEIISLKSDSIWRNVK